LREYRLPEEHVFFLYNDDVYFFMSLYNKVFKVTENGLEISYEWDFGDKTMDMTENKLSTTPENFTKDYNRLIEMLENSNFLYYFSHNYVNSRYYFAQFRTGKRVRKLLFYEKSTGRNYFFERPAEGIRIDVKNFSDGFVISTLDYEDRDKLLSSPLVSEADREKLRKYSEDDNPWLIKLNFKDP
jgi:hypothetical protein